MVNLFSQALSIQDLLSEVDVHGFTQTVLGVAVVDRQFRRVGFSLGEFTEATASNPVWDYTAHRGYITVCRSSKQETVVATFLLNFKTGEVTPA